MDNILLDYLKQNKIFSQLPPSAIELLINKLEKIDLKSDEILFQHGDIPEAVYLLVKGKVSASIITPHNQLKIFGHIDQGDTIGDLTVLGNTPYPYTAKAIHHCIVYKLLKKDFLDICYHHPQCMIEAVRPLIIRRNNMIKLLSKEDTHPNVIILPANQKNSLDDFAPQLIPLLLKNPAILLLSDYLPEYAHETNLSVLNEKIHHLEQHKKSNQQIIYLLKNHRTPLAIISLKKLDKLYLVTNALSEPKIEPEIEELILHHKIHNQSLPNLIILHPKKTLMPQHTVKWLTHNHFAMHHHVKIDQMKHYERLIRFLCQIPNGVVLAGGGTRGWGHIGAIKALCEAEFPIDYIGGTSVGALIGGCYALQESYEDTYHQFSKIIAGSKNSVSWRSITLPIVSIFNAKSFTESLEEVFTTTHIEDLWLPYFCMTSNITHGNEDIHRSGLLWEKIRASASIPGLIPPMMLNGEIHFDGGLLNNFPLDVMQQYIGKKGKIVGIEINSSMKDPQKYDFPPILTLKQALAFKMKLSPEHYKFPRFIEIFLKGLLIGSSAKTRHNSQYATILVNLNLRKFRLLKFNEVNAEKMLKMGYTETTLQLSKHRNQTL